MDLGSQPLSDSLLEEAQDDEEVFPLHLRQCTECGLGQVGEFASREHIFSIYPYLSSMSSIWRQHCRDFVTSQTSRLQMGPNDYVLEIASNDGCLLGEFQNLGVSVIGVEPAANIAEIANNRGIPAFPQFFGENVARQLLREFGHPKLIVANNVLAHEPDIRDFMSGISALAFSSTHISIEDPSFTTLLKEGQFDTIYHEHFSYLSTTTMQKLAAIAGLSLVSLEAISTHRSNRYWLRVENSFPTEAGVGRLILKERDEGLVEFRTHQIFRKKTTKSIIGLREWLTDASAKGESVVAYGVAAKGNTMLNAVGVEGRTIRKVLDASPEKQGKFLPGSRIPIVAPDLVSSLAPRQILLLPWNLRQEIRDFVKEHCPTTELWVAMPQMERIW